jgi:aspartyl-tRNA(Asn)/glutamyl-tRNA(Gln) amidotransferase subunit A
MHEEETRTMKREEIVRWRSLFDSPARLSTYRKEVQRLDESLGAFLDFDPGRPPEAAGEGGVTTGHELLRGLPFGVKDNIAAEGFSLTCASRALEGLPAPYSATAVEKLLRAGARPVGKTNLDEFGMGSSTENSAYRRTVNPWDPERTPGGSSGGSAAAVAAGMVPFALGSDTGGSVRQPAAFCGIYGLKPSYGSVSRYGLTAYASSLEGIGILSSDLELTEAVFATIRGADSKDQTTVDYELELRTGESSGQPQEQSPGQSLGIGVLEGIEGLSPAIEEGYRRTIDTFRELGFPVRTVELPMLEYVIPAYYTIASAEASANLARYTGIRYGYRNEWAEDPRELVETSRDESLGDEVKMRILLGTYVLRSGFQEQYYIKAQKIRSALRRDFASIFDHVDVLLMPVFPTRAFAFGDEELDPFRQKLADKFTATANLAGLPALSFPTGLSGGLPVGMQLLAPQFREDLLFRAAASYAGSHAGSYAGSHADDYGGAHASAYTVEAGASHAAAAGATGAPPRPGLSLDWRSIDD